MDPIRVGNEHKEDVVPKEWLRTSGKVTARVNAGLDDLIPIHKDRQNSSNLTVSSPPSFAYLTRSPVSMFPCGLLFLPIP
jgi:hypothetical protein